MPTIHRPEILRAVFTETLTLLRAGVYPSQVITANATLWRGLDSKYVRLRPDRLVPRWETNQNLVPRDGDLDVNRFTGISMFADIPRAAGLYCSVQADALTAELVHSARRSNVQRDSATGMPDVHATLGRKWALKLRCARSIWALDLSVYAAAARPFLDRIEQTTAVRLALQLTRSGTRPLWEQLFDSEDASVGRGVGLAAAAHGLDAIVARTARSSARGTDIHAGDNVVMLSSPGTPVPFLWIEEVWAFPPAGSIERYQLT